MIIFSAQTKQRTRPQRSAKGVQTRIIIIRQGTGLNLLASRKKRGSTRCFRAVIFIGQRAIRVTQTDV